MAHHGWSLKNLTDYEFNILKNHKSFRWVLMLNHSQIGILGLEKGKSNEFIIPYIYASEHLKYDFSLYPTIV